MGGFEEGLDFWGVDDFGGLGVLGDDLEEDLGVDAFGGVEAVDELVVGGVGGLGEVVEGEAGLGEEGVEGGVEEWEVGVFVRIAAHGGEGGGGVGGEVGDEVDVVFFAEGDEAGDFVDVGLVEGLSVFEGAAVFADAFEGVGDAVWGGSLVGWGGDDVAVAVGAVVAEAGAVDGGGDAEGEAGLRGWGGVDFPGEEVAEDEGCDLGEAGPAIG